MNKKLPYNMWTVNVDGERLELVAIAMPASPNSKVQSKFKASFLRRMICYYLPNFHKINTLKVLWNTQKITFSMQEHVSQFFIF